MAAVTVWTVVVCWVVVVVSGVVLGVVRGENGDNNRGKTFEMVSNPFSGLYARPPAKKSTEHFRFPHPGERRSETPRLYSAKIRNEEEEELQHKRKPRFSHGEMYFLPVRFDLSRNSFSDRSIRSDDYQPAPPSPRLIMDKDFNIRFDNPYIIPLTKPLALVLDSAVKARQDGYSGEKMMIPFPVLVKTRKPLLEREGFRDYRDDDDVPEHRSNYDDEDLYLEDTSTRKPTKKAISVRKIKKNGTTTYHNSNNQNPKISHKAQSEQSDHQLVPEGRIVNRKTNETVDQNQEDVLEDSSDEVTPTDTYPGKIFAEMYHKIPTYPKYPFDSLESQEFVSHKYEGSPTKKYVNEPTTEETKPLQRPRVKSASKYPINSQMFSASTDFEWVTQANSTKARKLPNNNETNNRRIIIHDVLEEPINTTTPPLISTLSSQDINISEQFWRQI